MRIGWLLLFFPLIGWAQTITTEEFTLHTATGTLHGTLTTPSRRTQNTPVMLLIAGSGPTDRDCNGPGFRTNAYKMLADSLAWQGVATLRYDKRGVGASKAAATREEDLSLDTFIEDAVAWADTLYKTRRFGTIAIAGHSEGSLIGMIAAQRSPAERFVSLAGAGRNIQEILKTQLAILPDSLRMDAYRSLDSLRAGIRVQKPNPFLYTLLRPSVQPFLISWMQYDPAREIQKLTIPVLIVQGGRDLQVAVSEATLLRQARPSSQWAFFEEMNHILKSAPAERNANLATYSTADLPITAGLAAALARFVKGN